MARALGPPGQGRRSRGQQDGDQKGFGHAVRQLGHGGLVDRGTLHQRNDLRIACGSAHLLYPQFNSAAEVVAAGNHRVTHLAVQGHGLSGQQSFIHLRLPGQHGAIPRESLPRQHLHHIPDPKLPDGHPLPAVVGRAPAHAVRQTVEHGFQRTGGAIAHAQLHPPPHQQEEHEHGERVEIHLCTERPLGLKGAQTADHESAQHADRHWQVHADTALLEIRPGRGKKRCAGKQHDRQRQHPAGPAQEMQHVRRDVSRLGHIGRRGIHHHLHHAQASHRHTPDHPAGFAPAAFVRMGIVGRQRLVSSSRCRPHPLRRTGLLRGPDNAPPVAGGADLNRLHAWHLAQRIFNRYRTGCAMHALKDHTGCPAGFLPRLGLAEIRPLLRIVEQRQTLIGDHRRRQGQLLGNIDRSHVPKIGDSHRPLLDVHQVVRIHGVVS